VGPLASPREKIEHGVDFGNKTLSLINEIRPKLATPYRDRSDAELAATGIFLVSTKSTKLTKN
jgi:hypothetical protein